MLHGVQRQATPGNVFRQQFRTDLRAGAQYYGALDHVFQFTHIAGPIVVEQRVQRLRRDAAGRPAIFLRELVKEEFHQQGNIFAAAAQR